MKLAQPLLDAFNLQAPLAGSADRQRFRVRQSCQRSDDPEVLLKGRRICPEPLLQNVFSVLENPPVSLRCEREKQVAVPNPKISALKNELKFTVAESLTVGIAKHREQNLVLDRQRRGMPIDIEVSCVRGSGSIFQNVHPPGIFLIRCHVIGNDVEKQPHAPLLKGCLEGSELFFLP